MLLVLGSDVIYSEDAVNDLLDTLKQLSGSHTTIFLSGELRNGKIKPTDELLFHFMSGLRLSRYSFYQMLCSSVFWRLRSKIL